MPGPQDTEYWTALLDKARGAWKDATAKARDFATGSPDVYVPPMPPDPKPPPAMAPKPPGGKFVDIPQPPQEEAMDDAGFARVQQLLRQMQGQHPGVAARLVTPPVSPSLRALENSGATDRGEEEGSSSSPPSGPTPEEWEYQWKKTHPNWRKEGF